ncbi:PRC-barrel domain-containing protein [Paractinoplanes rishiriensis]|uniref:PRC-barrel domain-containing protein n=1 Tax=Paractinoplanes rishiriensis TaxID=1050105 RepID=A0A919N0Z5_9ACTN|nr:PRC-barrel domain-containing protein [Actinoplanes rishiriensis]GIF00266.1 hypothetical protein Ari01nite_77300 [Actinoplanes rishiriensis]
MTDNDSSEDLGAPVAYLVLADGTAVYDRSGTRVGQVEHVLADEPANLFHGLIVSIGNREHRFVRAELVDGMFERGVIIAVPANELPEPSADPPARLVEEDAGLGNLLRKAWDRLTPSK